MEVKPGYKLTDVGVIPEDWGVKLLGELGKVVRGGSPRPAGDPRFFGGAYIPWLTVGSLTNIPSNQLDVTDTATCLTREGVNHSRTLEHGTLVIVNSGARTLGVAKILGLTCCANDGIAALTNQTAGDKRFLCYYLNTQTKRLRDVVAAGNDQLNLNTSRIAGIAVPFPSLPEQRAIAAVLGDVDALIGSLDRLITKKRDLKQAAMQQLLTGQTRLPGFRPAQPRYQQSDFGPVPADWELSTVGREFDIQLGKMLDADKNAGVMKPYLGNRAVQWGKIDTSDLPKIAMSPSDLERFRLHRGDLLVCEGGEVGRAAVWTAPLDECYFQKALHRLRPRRGFHSQLMIALLRLWAERGLLMNYVTQTSIAHLPKDKFVTIPLPVPEPVEQAAIAEVLSDMDAEIAALEHRREKTKLLKEGMMQELLTGRTRLV